MAKKKSSVPHDRFTAYLKKSGRQVKPLPKEDQILFVLKLLGDSVEVIWQDLQTIKAELKTLRTTAKK